MRMPRSPALHFLVIGGLLFAIAWQTGMLASPASARPQLTIPAYRIEFARREFVTATGRAPTSEQARKILAALIDQEVLYQYALRLGMHKQPVAERRLAQIASFVAENPHEVSMNPSAEAAPFGANTPLGDKSVGTLAKEARNLGLHHGDQVVRRILIDGARRLIRAVVLVREPSEEMLEAYLQGNPEVFLLPTRTRITQVAVNRLAHGEATEARAQALLERLQQGAYAPARGPALGDELTVPSSLPALTDAELARRLGYRFTQALKQVPEGVWSGPIPSIYGLHLVYLHERVAPRMPPLAAVRSKVRWRLRQKLADEWLALRVQQLREEFDIVVARVPT